MKLPLLVCAAFLLMLPGTAGPTVCNAQALYPLSADSLSQPDVPHGEMLHFSLTSARYYPGSRTDISVYVPSSYSPDRPACLYVGLDGPGFHITNVLDNLIYKKQIPVMIGIFVPAGEIDIAGKQGAARYDRCFEYDSTNDRFVRYLVDEVFPIVKSLKTSDGRSIHISNDPNDHMISGASSGGVCAFTAAWTHPDLFRRVFSAIGTYVGMRGADQYPTLIRKTEPKPIRIFMQDGAADSWNPLFDNWFTQNKSMEESLTFAGYDVQHVWGVLGHDGTQADSLLPTAMAWLWRDYPAPISAGISSNSMLKTILAPGESWKSLPINNTVTVGEVASDPSGRLYFADTGSGAIYRIGDDNVPVEYFHAGSQVTSIQFGPDSTLYAALASKKQIIGVQPGGRVRVIESGINVSHFTVLSDSAIYASETAPHSDMPSTLWRIDSVGRKMSVDEGLLSASGILVSGDQHMLFAAERSTHWIYSYALSDSGSLLYKQRFYWLHTAEGESDSDDDSAGASDLAEDTDGYVYAATRMGVQVCDQNGRVEGILTLPEGATTALTFFGKDFNSIAVVCGGKIYTRTLNAHGHLGFAKPIVLPNFGGG